jgi:hypothetical protein
LGEIAVWHTEREVTAMMERPDPTYDPTHPPTYDRDYEAEHRDPIPPDGTRRTEIRRDPGEREDIHPAEEHEQAPPGGHVDYSDDRQHFGQEA